MALSGLAIWRCYIVKLSQTSSKIFLKNPWKYPFKNYWIAILFCSYKNRDKIQGLQSIHAIFLIKKNQNSLFCANVLTIYKILVNTKMGNRRMAVWFIIRDTFPK